MLSRVVCRAVPIAVVTLLHSTAPTPSHMDRISSGVIDAKGTMLAVQVASNDETDQHGAECGGVNAAAQQLGSFRPHVPQLSGHREATHVVGAAPSSKLAGMSQERVDAIWSHVRPSARVPMLSAQSSKHNDHLSM